MEQMVPPGSRRAKRSVRWRRCQAALAACALAAFAACSVYDTSLLNGGAGLEGRAGANTSSSGGNSGSGGVPQSAAAGGTPSGAAGSSTTVSQGGANDGASAGENSNGDNAGASGSLANGGMDASFGGSIGGGPGGGSSGTTNGGGSSGTTNGGGSSGTTNGGGAAVSGGAGGVGAGNPTGGAVNGGGGGGNASAGDTSFGGSVSQILAALKPADASSTQAGNEPSHANDNNATTRWCASSADFPQWWRVDLGAVHLLSAAAVQFEHADHVYTYTIETSQDNLEFAVQANQTGMGAVQTVPFPAAVIARYVRITISNGTPQVPNNQTWASIIEFSVTGR